MMSDCLFCKIINGEIPTEKLYEDAHVIAFKDIHPQAPVHFLVVPKKHISATSEISPENSAEIAYVFEVIAKLAKQQHLENGFRVINNCGPDAGQTVPHLHFHVLAGKVMGETIV